MTKSVIPIIEADNGILDWIAEKHIANEKGDRIEWDNHPFLTDIYDDQSTNLTVMKAAQVGMSTCQILKNHRDAKRYKMDIIYCVDEETEILTQRGFLRQENLKSNDIILTLSKKGKTQWSPLQEIFRKEVAMECIEFNARNFNAVVTPNHRWLLQPYRGSGQMFFRETKDMIGKYARIPKSVDDEGATAHSEYYTNEEVSLLAWVFSEGHYPKQTKGSGKKCYSIIITQSEKVNAPYCDEIRAILRSLNVAWKEYLMKHNGCVSFRFAFRMGKEIRERFPEKIPDVKFALSLTKAQCKLFIDTFAKADGWLDSSGTWAIAQKDKITVDILCMIAVLAGYVPSVSKSGVCHTIRLTQFKSVETGELKPRIVRYKGIIWCPRTPAGTFYARRKGRCYWTGNTLPTDQDVRVFVGGKVNRIIANNKSMIDDVADKDSIEVKQVGNSIIYFRGTWSKKAAIMVTADRLVHDEKDSSKLDVIADYQSRTQHSKFKQTHTFSHPSLPETGVHADWLQSDQKHWFVKCPHCAHWQFLSWDTENPRRMSIDIERGIFICKQCHAELPDWVRVTGQWVARYPDRAWSGYWVSLLICPWMSAKEIVAKFKHPDTTPEFFYTKILGLPFADGSSKLLRQSFFQNLTNQAWAPPTTERVIVGIDTGLRLDYVIGNKNGLFFQGDCNDYCDLDVLMKRWPRAIAFMDAGGDLIGSRAFAERWIGRVFLIYFVGDRNQEEIFTFGKGDDCRSVKVDRNRGIQLVIDEFRNRRVPVHGTENDWFEYWLDWNNLSKMKVLDPDTNATKGYKWVRSGRDHKALATVCWRAGMSRFVGMGAIIEAPLSQSKQNSYMIEAGDKVSFSPDEMFNKGIQASLDRLDEESIEW
uniref:Putative terminase n=1 Tax=viral metagenome TaxID=1070528 RepID=A0A6H1ZQB4_9ZZZZ